MIKFCHYLTKRIITRIIVSLKFKNVIIRAAVLFSEILQILSLFNQAYYYTNYYVFSVWKCYYKDWNYCFQRFYEFG